MPELPQRAVQCTEPATTCYAESDPSVITVIGDGTESAKQSIRRRDSATYSYTQNVYTGYSRVYARSAVYRMRWGTSIRSNPIKPAAACINSYSYWTPVFINIIKWCSSFHLRIPHINLGQVPWLPTERFEKTRPRRWQRDLVKLRGNGANHDRTELRMT